MNNKLLIRIFAFSFLFSTLFFLESKAAPDELVVGTRQVPPFAIQDKEGNWSGITIELWEAIAKELGLSYRYKPVSLDGAFSGLQDGTIDVAAAAFSITSEREEIVDFSHSFYSTGLGIAVKSQVSPPWLRVLRGVISWEFFRVLMILGSILLFFGFLIWLFEKKRNQAQFGGSPFKGIGSGFWWSAVTMTTVGYGDKSPVTLGGRLVALIWMFSGIIFISTITAAITSALTVASLDIGIEGPQDLPGLKAGTITETTSADYFFERGMNPRLYTNAQEGLRALAAGDIEAFVYDAPILAYFINQNYPGQLSLIPAVFEEQQYGIALPLESRLRQDINHELLLLIERSDFKKIEQRYLGSN